MEETTLEKNLRILDKCIRELSKEDLNGKYQKSFKNLLKNIRDEINNTVCMYILNPIVMEHILTKEEQESLQKIVDEYRKQIQEQIYKLRSANGFYETLAHAQSAVFTYVRNHGCFIDDTKLPTKGIQ